MDSRLADQLDRVHPQMLRLGGESDRKKLAVGRTVERALEILGMTKQAAAYAMGYADPGPVSRWCAATERPLFDKLFAIDRFEECWIVALAEKNPAMEVETVVKFRRAG